MKAWLRVWPYVKRYRGTLLLGYVCMLLLALTTAVYAFLAGPALVGMFNPQGFSDVFLHNEMLQKVLGALPHGVHVWVVSHVLAFPFVAVPLLLVFTACLKGLAQTGQFYSMGRVSQWVLRDMRQDVFDVLLKQSASFFNTHAQGDMLTRLTWDTQQVEQALFYGFAPVVRESLALVFLWVMCMVAAPSLVLATCVTVPLAVFPLRKFARKLKRVSHGAQNSQGDMGALCAEVLSGIRVVQAFGAEPRESARLKKVSSQYLKHMKRSYLLRALRTPTMEVVGALSLAVLIGWLGYRVHSHHADPAVYVSFFTALILMYEPLKKLGNVGDYLATGGASLHRLLEVLDAPLAVKDAPHAVVLNGFEKEVQFDGVSFAYGDQHVLEGVSCVMPKGTVTALVGPSGAGKTTMAGLLTRVYDVSSGAVRVDGRDVRDVTLESLRAHVAVVGQDTFLFNASVYDNIAYARPEATQAEVEEAASLAYATEFIEKLPQGFQTCVGERGVMLSGGQRQRMAIARAFLSKAPLVVLDEATSHLDIESERWVQRALEKLLQQKTALVIAHRLSTVVHAHAIAVLSEGKVVEYGTHAQLLQNEGLYAKLFHMQFETQGLAE
jgi:subfamily B ATP-binding cassette protein MsbA